MGRFLFNDSALLFDHASNYRKFKNLQTVSDLSITPQCLSQNCPSKDGYPLHLFIRVTLPAEGRHIEPCLEDF